MTPSSRIGCAAAGLFLLALGHSANSATAVSQQTGPEPLPPLYVPPAPAPAVRTQHHRYSDAGFGQVDVFIDLACPQSAAAWPTLKRIVREQRHRVDFVFHVLPLSEYPIGFFAAKAVQVLLANSDGTYDDVEGFIDWVFRGQRIILYEQEMDMTLDAREIVSDWALSTSNLSAEKLISDMKDPAFDEKVLNDLENRFLAVAVASTPTVLFNGIFMMHLEADRQLQDFEIFLGDADTDVINPPSYSDGSRYADDDDNTDDSSPTGSSLSAWREIKHEIRDDYDDMQRQRKAQLAARERRRFEQAQKRVQQQLQELDAQQQEQLKQLLLLEQDQLKHLLLEQDEMEAAVTHRTAGSGSPPPPSSSAALGFSTPPRYTMPYYTAVSSEWSLPSPYSSSSPSSSFARPSSPYAHAAPSTSTSGPPRSWWSTFSSSFAAVDEPSYGESADREETAVVVVDEPSAGDTLIAEAKALVADWASKRGVQKQHLRQQRPQQNQQQEGGVRDGQGWLSFLLRSLGWPAPEAAAVAAAAPGEESVQEGSGGAGGVGQEGGGGESRVREGIHFEEAAAPGTIAVKP